MTADTRPSFLTRVMDAVFGKTLSPDERLRLEASRPPEVILRVYRILQLASFLAVLTTFLWSYGWLPFVDSRIGSSWFWSAFGFNVLLRFGGEQTTGFYERRAKAGEALKAASPE